MSGSFLCERGWLVRTPLRLEAVAAVDRLLATGTERHLRLAPAARARGTEHLARTAIVTAAGVPAARGPTRAAGCLAARPARRAASRLGELAVSVELLLARGEHELLAAVGTAQGLVGLCVQRNTPSPAASANLLAENRGEGVIDAAGQSVAPWSTPVRNVPRPAGRVEHNFAGARGERCCAGR